MRKTKLSHRLLKEIYEFGDPIADLLGEPSGKFDFYVIYGDQKTSPSIESSPCTSQLPHTKPALPKPLALSPQYQKDLKHLGTSKTKSYSQAPLNFQPPICYMFNLSSSGYKTNFLVLDEFEDVQQCSKHKRKVKTPTIINSYGQQKTVSAVEATLNCQANNAIAQNEALSQLVHSQNSFRDTYVYTRFFCSKI